MRELIFEAQLDRRCRGIAAADYRHCVRQLGDRLADFDGAVGISRVLEDAHRSVPDNRLSALQFFFEQFDRLRSDIQAHKARWNFVIADRLDFRCVFKRVGNNRVYRQDQLVAALSQKFLRHFDPVFF